MQTANSLEKLEAPVPVLQQQLHEERDKAGKLQSQVKTLRASALVLEEAVSGSHARQAELVGDLQSIRGFIDD